MDIKNLLCSSRIASDAAAVFMNDDDSLSKTLTYHLWHSTMSDGSYSEDNSTSSSPDMSSCYYNTSPSLTVASSPTSSPTTLSVLLPHTSLSAPTTGPRPPTVPGLQKSTPQTRTPWTHEEDYLLQRGYSQGMSWAMVSTTYLPHRSRGCCWGRFKTLKTKAVEQHKWTKAEEQRLAISLKNHASLFKQAWNVVARDMPNRSWRDCESRFHKVTAGNMVRKKPSSRH